MHFQGFRVQKISLDAQALSGLQNGPSLLQVITYMQRLLQNLMTALNDNDDDDNDIDQNICDRKRSFFELIEKAFV